MQRKAQYIAELSEAADETPQPAFPPKIKSYQKFHHCFISNGTYNVALALDYKFVQFRGVIFIKIQRRFNGKQIRNKSYQIREKDPFVVFDG